MKLTLKYTFTKVAVLTYCMGACVHLTVLVTGQPGNQMPDIAHWLVTLLAGYAGIGFIVNIKKTPFKGLGDKVIYGLVLFHLMSSALVHAYSIIWHTNDWLSAFSYSYSYFALVYFVLFGYYSLRLDKRLNKQ